MSKCICFGDKCERHSIDNFDKLEEKLQLAEEALIFYSDMEEFEESYEQLDWFTVNREGCEQDKGKRAREYFKKAEEMKKEEHDKEN